MAKAKSNAETQKGMSEEKLMAQLKTLTRRLESVECTAITVEVALRGQRVDYDLDIAICVGRNIVDELDRIGQELTTLIVALGGERPMPLREL